MTVTRRLLATTTSSIGAQPADPDLSTFAGLDSATAGALATDGAGWIRKTYAQLKTALSLTNTDVGLGNVTNNAQVVKLVLTSVKTSGYTAAANEFVPVDTTSGNVTVTLPTAPADGARVGIKHVVRGAANTITVALGGSDVLNVTGGATTGTITLLNQATIFQYKSSDAIWYATGDDMPLSQLDLRFQPLDADLTAIAGLTATTDNLLQAKGSAWASRTLAQVAADLVAPLSASPLGRGVQTPQTITYAASITPDAATGGLFRCTATGNLTLNEPTGGSDGQTVSVEILASGADRTVSFAGGNVLPVIIPSGQWWTGALRYNAAATTWLLVQG